VLVSHQRYSQTGLEEANAFFVAEGFLSVIDELFLHLDCHRF
jgi:hypothetical protein